MSAPGWQYRIVSVRPSGAVRKTRTTPLKSSSKYGALSASRWVTDPAGIRVRTEPTMSSSRASGGSTHKCDASAAARMSASTSATYGTARLPNDAVNRCHHSPSATDGLRDCSGLRHRGGMSSTTLESASRPRPVYFHDKGVEGCRLTEKVVV